MSRQKQSLAEAPQPASREEEVLRSFPSTLLEKGKRFFRVVRKKRGPWWFGSSGDGRFDLLKPSGTCYLAEGAFAAVLEILGPTRDRPLVTEAFFESRELLDLPLPHPFKVADASSKRSASFGITLELGTTLHYKTTQGWARSFEAAGFGGLRYRLRHDPSGERGLALFGKHGERRSWSKGREVQFNRNFYRDLAEATGIQVHRGPEKAELDFVE